MIWSLCLETFLPIGSGIIWKGLSVMTATVMGETIAAGMSPALALSLPRKEETYPLTFFPSLLSREGLALPDCVFHAFVLLIRRKVVRSRRRKDV